MRDRVQSPGLGQGASGNTVCQLKTSAHSSIAGELIPMLSSSYLFYKGYFIGVNSVLSKIQNEIFVNAL